MKIIVIGAGNWGTTLSCIFSRKHDVSLWTNTFEGAEEINTRKENIKYLKGIPLPARVKAAQKFTEPIEQDDLSIIAVPSNHLREVAQELSTHITGQPVVCGTKGFEHTTLKTMSEVIQEEIPGSPVVVISGPNIAAEIAFGKPTKAVLACKDFGALPLVAKVLKNEYMSFEISNDVKGVELCAALKGIIAIGVGIADGLELGKNFMGLLMTYGLKEFSDIAGFLGINPKTIYGIAGLGDLIATCLSPNSRNRKFGYLLGKGIDRDTALMQVGMVVEGVQMAKTIAEFDNLNIPIPLFSTIAKIIFQPNGHVPQTFVDCLINYRIN